jgi:beta-lactamase class A
VKKRLLWVLLLKTALCCAFAPAGARAQDTVHLRYHAQFQASLASASTVITSPVGYYLRDLKTGEEFIQNPDVVFPTASSIKLAILLELLLQDQQHLLSLDEKHTLRRSETVAGDPILYMLGDGTVTMTLRDIATFMVVLSDNSAANILIDRVGMTSVNLQLAALGLRQTQLRRKMMDLNAARQGNENVSTPRELARLLQQVHSGKVLDAAHTREYFRLLGLPKDSLFNRALPAGVTIEDKPGALEAVRCDAGIIELPGHPLDMVIMSAYLRDEQQGEQVIEHLAGMAYKYFDLVARSSAYGRVVSDK